jgi:hypothetical protein
METVKVHRTRGPTPSRTISRPRIHRDRSASGVPFRQPGSAPRNRPRPPQRGRVERDHCRVEPDLLDRCLAGQPGQRRSRGKLPDPVRNERFHAHTLTGCPDRQVIVSGTTPNPARLSVAPRRTTDYYLSVGTPAPGRWGSPPLRGVRFCCGGYRPAIARGYPPEEEVSPLFADRSTAAPGEAAPLDSGAPSRIGPARPNKAPQPLTG